MRIYLFLAAFWLLVASAAFVFPRLQPDGPRWTILDTDWSIGWLLLLFAVWNVMRWWLTTQAQRVRRRSTPDDEASRVA